MYSYIASLFQFPAANKLLKRLIFSVAGLCLIYCMPWASISVCCAHSRVGEWFFPSCLPKCIRKRKFEWISFNYEIVRKRGTLRFVYCINISSMYIGPREPLGNGARTLPAATASARGQTQLPIADQFWFLFYKHGHLLSLSSLQMFV